MALIGSGMQTSELEVDGSCWTADPSDRTKVSVSLLVKVTRYLLGNQLITFFKVPWNIELEMTNTFIKFHLTCRL